MSSPPPVGDAHTHVHRSRACARLLAAAGRAGVSPIVVCATSSEDWRAVENASLGQPARAVASFGVHPWWASSCALPEQLAGALEAQLRALPGAAVGEVGLDLSPRGVAASAWDTQLAVLRPQLRVAARLGRALSLHCVRAYGPLAAELAAAVKDVPPAAGFGVLMHSYAGSAAWANEMLLFAKAAPCLFSFNGAVAVAAGNEFEMRAMRGGGSGSGCGSGSGGCSAEGPDAETETPLAPSLAHAVPRGAGKDSIKTLERLPHEHLCFETDTPDQPFLHLLSSAYLAWTRAVFGEAAAEAEDTADAAVEEADAAADVREGEVGPVLGCCRDEEVEGEGGASRRCLEAPAPNRPVLVRHVVRAAALFRVAHGAAPGGEPLQQRSGSGRRDGGGAADATGGGLVFLALAPADVPPAIAERLRSEYAALCAGGIANLRRLFGNSAWARESDAVRK